MDWRAKRLLAGWCALVVLSVTSDWTWRVAVVSAFLISMALLKPRMRVAAGVRYSRFPYRTGEPAKFDVRFAKQASAGELQSFACRLRCVSETPRRGFVVFWPEVTCLLDVPGPPAMREPADAEFAVQFDVPADAPGTDLLAEPAIYWELVIDSVWAGGRFEQAFQVPVYGTPSVRP